MISEALRRDAEKEVCIHVSCENDELNVEASDSGKGGANPEQLLHDLHAEVRQVQHVRSFRV